MWEMKDGGTSWLGMVSSHCNIDKLKYHLVRNEPRNPSGKTILSLYRELKVVPKDSRDDNHVITCFCDGEVTLRSNRREDGVTMADKEIGYQNVLATDQDKQYIMYFLRGMAYSFSLV